MLQPADQQQELDKLINEWANLSYKRKNYKRSDELYALLDKERPDSELADDARLILAESLRFSNKTDEARVAFARLADDPRSDDLVKQRSLVHLLDLAADAGDWNETLKVSERFTSEFPQSPHRTYGAYRRGEALLQQERFAEGAEVLQALRTELSTDLAAAPAWWPEAWILLAEAKYWLKDYEAVAVLVADLKAKAPRSDRAYRADGVLGKSLENQARWEEAREAYTRVVESEAGRGTQAAAEAQFRIAESYLKEKNFHAALQEYYKVYAGYNAPRFQAAALYQAAGCDASLANHAQARDTYRKLLQEFPDSNHAEDARRRLNELERTP
jgi:TolA-binding protein